MILADAPASSSAYRVGDHPALERVDICSNHKKISYQKTKQLPSKQDFVSCFFWFFTYKSPFFPVLGWEHTQKIMAIRKNIQVRSPEHLMPSDQSCTQCGRCCEKWGWGQKGVIDDIIPWIQADRQDILQHVSLTLNGKRRCNGRDISKKDLPDVTRIDYWVDPGGGH